MPRSFVPDVVDCHQSKARLRQHARSRAVVRPGRIVEHEARLELRADGGRAGGITVAVAVGDKGGADVLLGVGVGAGLAIVAAAVGEAMDVGATVSVAVGDGTECCLPCNVRRITRSGTL